MASQIWLSLEPGQRTSAATEADKDIARPLASHPLSPASFQGGRGRVLCFRPGGSGSASRWGNRANWGLSDGTGFLGMKCVAFLRPGTAHTSGRRQKSLVRPTTPTLTSVSSGTQGVCWGQASPQPLPRPVRIGGQHQLGATLGGKAQKPWDTYT